jgi:uncharacterized protein DUF1918
VEKVNAQRGDQLLVKSGDPGTHGVRTGEILEVGPGGAPPYVVRWDDGRVSIMFPGPESRIDHLSRRPHAERRARVDRRANRERVGATR